MYVCMYLCMGGHFSTNVYEIWQGPLGSVSEELIRLGSKSENAFPYFNPQTPKFIAEIGNSAAKC